LIAIPALRSAPCGLLAEVRALRTRIRKLGQIELWEISIVTFLLLSGARVRAVKDARGAASPESDGLFLRYPRFSFARKQAERDWQAVAPAAAAAPGTTSPAANGKRLETVQANRQTAPRRRRAQAGARASRGVRRTVSGRNGIHCQSDATTVRRLSRHVPRLGPVQAPGSC
jgi:hypothetical protein